MGQQEKVATSLAGAVSEGISASLASVDAELERRYPGDPGTRQPVHTVYVPGNLYDAGTIRSWGETALKMLDEHAPNAAAFAEVLGLDASLADAVYTRVRAKLEREPIEDLRVDFEDGYTGPAAEEDAYAARAARLVAASYKDGTAAPYTGIRMKCFEAPVRERAIRTLDVFLTGLMENGGLPDGLVLTLPKVTYCEQVTAMVRLVEAFEKAHGLPEGRIGFEIQIETSQSILGADGTATVDSAPGEDGALPAGALPTDADLKTTPPKSPGKDKGKGKDGDKKTPPPAKDGKKPDKADGGKTSGGGNGGATTGGSGGGKPGGGSSGSGGSTGGNSGTTTGGNNNPPPPAPVCHGVGGGKYNCDVWRTSDSIRANGDRAGTLNAGTNYFYCQSNLGRRTTYGKWTNVWWAKTDDDSGNTNVYVSVVYLKGGDNDQPLPGLPAC
ncbi:hypothetical protein SSPIM334S_06446 [Streptomyces spiroverticillatus]